MEDKISLDVSGQTFSVKRDQLNTGPPSQLVAQCKTGTSTLTIDRPVDSFSAVLSLYQTGELHIPTSLCPLSLLNELEYWNISPALIAQCCMQRLNQFLDEQELITDFKRYQEERKPKFRFMFCDKADSIRQNMWTVVDYTEPTVVGSIYFAVSLLMILVSILSLAYSTDPTFSRDMTTCEAIDYLLNTDNNITEEMKEHIESVCSDNSNLTLFMKQGTEGNAIKFLFSYEKQVSIDYDADGTSDELELTLEEDMIAVLIPDYGKPDKSQLITTEASEITMQRTTVLDNRTTSTDQPTAVLADRTTSTDHPTAVLAERTTSTDHQTAVQADRTNSTDHPNAVLAERTTSTDQPTAVLAELTTSTDHQTAVLAERTTSTDHPTAVLAELTTSTDHQTAVLAERTTSTDQPTAVTEMDVTTGRSLINIRPTDDSLLSQPDNINNTRNTMVLDNSTSWNTTNSSNGSLWGDLDGRWHTLISETTTFGNHFGKEQPKLLSIHSLSTEIPLIKLKVYSLVVSGIVTTIFFTVDFLLRIVSCPCILRYFMSAINIVDTLSLASTYLHLLLMFFYKYEQYDSTWLKILEYCQIARAFRLFRTIANVRAGKVLSYTMLKNWRDLMLIGLFLIAGMCIFASCFYISEDHENVRTIPQAWYWAVITMTTVGYGDISPKTFVGRMFASLCAITGILLMSLTVPIFAHSFMTLYNHADSQNTEKKIRQWRKYINTHERHNGHTPMSTVKIDASISVKKHDKS